MKEAGKGVSEEQQLRNRAIQEFLWRCTVPLMVEIEESRTIPQGTGTLFRIDNRYFIITARHVFDTDKSRLECLAIPIALTSKEFIRIGSATYYVPDRDFIDVAVIEITHGDTISAAAHHWDFLTLDNVKTSLPTSSVWLTGYPEDKVEFTQRTTLSFEPVTIQTDLLKQVPPDAKKPVYEGLDLFFHYEHEAEALGKGVQPTPKLPGVSGASIWEVVGEPTEGETWVPVQFMKAVAVQSAYRHSDYIRAMSWLAVAKLFAKIDDQLRNAVISKTGELPDEAPTL